MINLNHHIYRCGPIENYDLSDEDIKKNEKLRKHIEPWLTAVFQSEHLSLLLGSGFTSGVASAAGGNAANMTKCAWTSELDLKEKVNEYAEQIAKVCSRGAANIEDQIRTANMQMLLRTMSRCVGFKCLLRQKIFSRFCYQLGCGTVRSGAPSQKQVLKYKSPF